MEGLYWNAGLKYRKPTLVDIQRNIGYEKLNIVEISRNLF